MQTSQGRVDRDAAILAALNGPTPIKPLAVSKRVAAAMVGLSTRSIENYIALKKLEARKIGRRTVILVASLEKFLRSDQASISRPRRESQEVRG
jgi:hypothetical protein